jgi:16S rRNA (cytidine1402-2'-O)-methyltransferase
MNCGDRLASMSEQIAAGAALYVVGTPIGNLEDITLRALRILKECDLIACEDTRQTAKLLNHFGISTRTVSYHEHNEKERAEELLKEFARGSRVALVSDAGMPGISDPGYRLIAIAIESKVPVVPVPGPAAFVAALAASGLPTDAFRFNGFLPAKRGQRKQALESVRDSDVTEMFYEAPHRVKDTLEDMVEVLGRGRPVVVAREITKMYEEFLRGSAAEVLAMLNSRGEVKGEITLLIGKASESEIGPSQISVRERMAQIMTEEKLDEKVALKKVAKEMGISKSEAYREWQRGKE